MDKKDFFVGKGIGEKGNFRLSLSQSLGVLHRQKVRTEIRRHQLSKSFESRESRQW